jgi:lysophospholipase L1-like esterase
VFISFRQSNPLLVCALLAGVQGYAVAGSKTIALLGSSTAQGVGASSYQASWAGLLTAALAGRGLVLQNVSISATNTGDSLARFDRDVTPLHPAIVILATSIANEPSDKALSGYLSNTMLLIRKVEAIGAIPVLVLPYPYNGFSAATYSGIRDIYRTFEAAGVPVLDFLDGTDDGQGHWIAGLSVDGTHPTDVGHRLLFDSIPVTLFESLLGPSLPANRRGYGSWSQNTGPDEEGSLDVAPLAPVGSWTVSFWTRSSAAVLERVLVSINGEWLQVRRIGDELEVWNGAVSVARLRMSSGARCHQVAVTYQSITGSLNIYIDGALQSAGVVRGSPATSISFGGAVGLPLWNATGDEFADVLVYRAPLAAADVARIAQGEPPWKSVEAWLPLTSWPDRPYLNFAASVVAVTPQGKWAWSADSVSLPTRYGSTPRPRTAEPAIAPAKP